jgi:hypothetical protein
MRENADWELFCHRKLDLSDQIRDESMDGMIIFSFLKFTDDSDCMSLYPLLDFGGGYFSERFICFFAWDIFFKYLTPIAESWKGLVILVRRSSASIFGVFVPHDILCRFLLSSPSVLTDPSYRSISP